MKSTTPIGCLAEAVPHAGAGVPRGWLHAGRSRCRFPTDRLLQGPRSPVLRERSSEFLSRIQAQALFPSATAHHRPLLLRERSRIIAGPVGSGTHSGEDEELRVGGSANGGPVLLSG